jgi:NADPH-dependent curcumin reductase CurA
LAAACPRGIDVYFENVGGHVWEGVFPLLNDFARVPVCGLIAHYNEDGVRPGPDRLPQLMRAVLSKRLALRGFIVTDFATQADDFRRDVAAWLREGKIQYKEDVVTGLENAPQAFIGLLKGKNFGKLLVKVGE